MLGLTAAPQRATNEFRQAAIHEAGHLVAIRALGGMGDARIWHNLSSREDEKRGLDRRDAGRHLPWRGEVG